MSSLPPFVKKTPFHLLSLFLLIPLTCLSVLFSCVSLVHYLINNYKCLVNYVKDRVDPVGKAIFVTGE